MSFGQCVICREVLADDMVATLCGHVFHRKCLATWLQQSRICPNCRSYCSSDMWIRLYPEITHTTCSNSTCNEEGTCKSGAVVRATRRQVLQLQRQCAALSDYIDSLGSHIEQFRQNIDNTTRMLRDIHTILDDMADPRSLTLEEALGPDERGSAGGEETSRQTLFSRADLSDLQTVVQYLENRITFYENLYGNKDERSEV